MIFVLCARLKIIVLLLLLLLDDAYQRSELGKGELEFDLNRLRHEESNLREALLKMQALNDIMGQEKNDLNRIIVQVLITPYYEIHFVVVINFLLIKKLHSSYASNTNLDNNFYTNIKLYINMLSLNG